METITEIKNLIEGASDAEEGALLVMIYLEQSGLSLEGNGWLEGDPLEGRYSAEYLALRSKIKEILN
jgi:hypothetical protein